MLVYTQSALEALNVYGSIHILGDSFSGGVYATAGHTYRELLLVSMQAVNAGLGATSWSSHAITGGKLTGQLSDIPGALGVFYDPDLVILAMGQNDVTAAETSADFRSAAEQILDYAINTMAIPIIVVAIPLQPTWTGATLTRALEFNAILEEEAGTRGMPYLAGWADCLTAGGLSQSGDVPLEATAYDGYHPNNTGHQQLHDALWAELETTLYLDL